MKNKILLIVVTFFFINNYFSQTSLEMFAGAGNPTGNGPVQSTSITLQDNTNNPVGNTAVAANNPVTITYTLGNHAYPFNNNNVGTNFIANIGATTAAANIFPLMNAIGSPSNSYFTAGSVTGQGIDVNVNRTVLINAYSVPLRTNNIPVSGRARVSDLTLTFSRPVTNPILHLAGMGNVAGGNTLTTEFTILGGYTLTRLSGIDATGFVVPLAPNNNQINNENTNFAQSGSGSGSGSVRVNGTNITSLTIQIYFDSGTGTTWGNQASDGDVFTLAVSLPDCTVNSLKPTVSSPLTNSCPANFADLNTAFTSTLPAGAELQWFSNNTHSGTPFTSVEVSQATSGTYYAFFYDAVNNCYSNASDPVTVNISPCCPTFTTYSTTGWKAKVYDAPAGTDAWTQISSSTTFPTTSYSQVATFDYNVKAGTNDAFSIDFQTRATGLTPSNPQIQNYVGTQIYNNPAWPIGDPRINEDYAVLFSKTVVSGEAGTYKFDLTYGDDHIFIYKNGVKINQMDNAYSLFPFPNFANINLAVGDVISVLMVEEYEFNTEVKIFGDKNPNVQNIANTCPSTTANLNDAFLGGTAPGVSLVWFNNNSHTGTPLTATEIANAAAGTYYAFYYNGSGCYSAASNAVIVTINSCVCFKDPINNGTGTATKTGVTLLKRAGNNDPDNWPMTRKSGHIALESNTQGFVITRIAKADFGNITNPQEGMMVYDTTDKCLKIYSDNAWKCFNIPACP